MGFVVIWIVLALVCAVVVLAGAGKAARGAQNTESQWRAWVSDLAFAFEPVNLRIQRAFAKAGKTDSARLTVIEERLAQHRSERKQNREIAAIMRVNESDSSNTSLDDFLRATATTEEAYVEAEMNSGTLESLYDTVQERRQSHKISSAVR